MRINLFIILSLLIVLSITTTSCQKTGEEDPYAGKIRAKLNATEAKLWGKWYVKARRDSGYYIDSRQLPPNGIEKTYSDDAYYLNMKDIVMVRDTLLYPFSKVMEDRRNGPGPERHGIWFFDESTQELRFDYYASGYSILKIDEHNLSIRAIDTSGMEHGYGYFKSYEFDFYR